jgi:hypothetical protein
MQIGKILIYKLTSEDAAVINRRRTTSVDIRERIGHGQWPAGAQAHIGSPVVSGQEYPMIVTSTSTGILVDGQVFLSGSDTYWVENRNRGSHNGQWRFRNWKT